MLETAGMSAVLLLPLVFEGATIALLEIYRRAPQAWTNTQVDRARVLANDIAAALARDGRRAAPDPRRRSRARRAARNRADMGAGNAAGEVPLISNAGSLRNARWSGAPKVASDVVAQARGGRMAPAVPFNQGAQALCRAPIHTT